LLIWLWRFAGGDYPTVRISSGIPRSNRFRGRLAVGTSLRKASSPRSSTPFPSGSGHKRTKLFAILSLTRTFSMALQTPALALGVLDYGEGMASSPWRPRRVADALVVLYHRNGRLLYDVLIKPSPPRGMMRSMNLSS
jgi:hypothetical protein